MASLAEVERLIQQLYHPDTSTEVDNVQKQLQAAQRSSGWELADGLMRSSHQNVRFFGALTFTVKINQDGAPLEENDFNALLSVLLKWLVVLTNEGEGILVLRKLCSTLITLFLTPNSRWRRCLRHIMCCLYSDAAVPETSTSDYPDTSILIRHLSFSKKFIILTVTKDLAESAARVEHTSQRFNYCHERVQVNLEDAVEIINYALSSVQTDFSDYQNDVLQCYQSWIFYARQEYTLISEQFQRLRRPLGAVSLCLFVPSTFEAAAEFFTDLFSADDSIFSPEEAIDFAQLFNTPWAAEYLAKVERYSESDDTTIFGQLLSAFAQAISRYMVESPATYRDLLSHMHLITRSQRFETVDQSLSNACIDFWESFVSHVNDFELDAETGKLDFSTNIVEVSPCQLRECAKAEWLCAIEELCNATTLPRDKYDDLRQLGADHVFSEFRARVQSAVQSSYTAFQHAVLEKLVELSLVAYGRDLSRSSCWAQVEAIFNCLGGLSESMRYEVSDQTAEDDALRNLFSSSMFADLTNFTWPVPSRLRNKAITIIGEHVEFLGRHDLFLLNALEILFRAVEQPGLARTASHAIFTLCNSNRAVLGSKIQPFMEVSERFFVSKTARPSSKKNVAGAIAAIAQALPSIDDQIHVIERLLSAMERDYQSRVALLPDAVEMTELRQAARLSTLEQLSAVGKASQTPDDVPIDLDADSDDINTSWASTQARVIHFLGLLIGQSLDDGNIVEATFNVLRTGYRETQPGPFVFDPLITANLIVSTHRQTPRVDVAVSNAAALLASHATRVSKIQPALPMLIRWLCSIIDPDLAAQDPELSNACLEFMNRLIPRHVNHISELSPQASTALFNFALQCLDSGEVLPKRSAAGFWTSILDGTTPDVSNLARNLLVSHGPALVTVLINNFGGDASRSQLDWLAEPYRKLIFRHGNTPWKSWTQHALLGSGFPSDRVSEADKERFLKQLEQLRGDRKTNTVVREFWLACRGTPVGYG